MRTFILLVLLAAVGYMALAQGVQSNDYQDQYAAEKTRADAAVVERNMARERVEALEQEYEELNRLAQSMEQERREKADQIAGLNEALANLTAERDRLAQELAAATAQYGDLSAQAEALRASLAEKEQALSDLRARLAEVEAALAARDLELTGARQRVSELEAQLAAQDALVQDLQGQVAQLTGQLESAERKLAARPLWFQLLLPAGLLAGGVIPVAAYGIRLYRRRRNGPLLLSRQPRWLALAGERAYYHHICLTQRKKA